MPLDAEYDPNERIAVTRQHLQEVMAALSWCHGVSSAIDLVISFREGRENPKRSRMTVLIANAYNHIEGYLTDVSIPEE